ncbi:HlyD family secretion protein [Enhydrobacter aerosaccus]|uniref:HlyD family secretion protein n=1 Tax=Enhydrobacter aerosaccus TaxID=225324 RepID=A0A1T4RZM4_9HYPH|nr:HlyD family efflux transporter periplasmic adaptor subunit [Enhydrobacter aerosaccus]SKA21433.1 HlyD family secretion protein [Enhydrobacter aerosaccus]
MAREKKFTWGAATGAILFVIAAVVLWVAPSRQTSSAQDGAAAGPLIARGYTDAPAGTAAIAGDAAGGGVLLELRVAEGQKVKRDEVIAVLSNYPIADVSVRSAEAELEKAKRQREAMVSGYRVAEIAEQEVAVKSAMEENKLKALELQRSGKPPDQKQLELNISEQKLEREQAKLRVMKETLATDLAQIDTDISIRTAKLDNARTNREQALVRSPLDGVVVQIWTRPGERINQYGVAKIVDMNQMRVFADVDEVHLGRVVVGGTVDVTFRGSSTIFKGHIVRIAPSVKRMQRTEPDGGSATDARVVQVEIKLDDPGSVPQVLGRETRVTFL